MMNSNEGSREMDASAGLGNYVRLSFCAYNPMMHIALEEKRISEPVVLEINLEVVSRPGVLFSDCNATRMDAVTSPNPAVVRFEYSESEKSVRGGCEGASFLSRPVACAS